jgi:ERCC4-type nuclease
MLVSPTERPPLNTLGKTSSLPEKLGVDFLMFSPVFGTVGVQRKEINDLVASLSDGRVTREVIDMKELDVGIWLIEGRPQWNADGQLLSAKATFTATSYFGVCLSLASQGFWLWSTASVTESMSWLSALDAWMAKTSHKGLTSRPNPRSEFGTQANKRDWQIHLTQSLPGVGYDRAKDIVRHYGGLPFGLRDGVDLAEVKGIGKVLKKRIEQVFE